MKYNALISGLVTLAVMTSLASPVLAEASAASEKPVMAKSSAAQRATAELVSARIRSALNGEPYATETICNRESCTVSESR